MQDVCHCCNSLIMSDFNFFGLDFSAEGDRMSQIHETFCSRRARSVMLCHMKMTIVIADDLSTCAKSLFILGFRRSCDE